MTLASFLSGTFGGTNIFLFEFTIGATVYRYAKAKIGGSATYSFGGNDYTAIPLSHGEIPLETDNIEDAELDIAMPRSSAFATAVINGLGTAEASVLVRELFAEDPDQESRVLFRGRMVDHKFFFGDGRFGKLALRVEDIFTRGRRPISGRILERTCPHAVYKGGCGLDIAAFNVAGTVSAITGNTLTVTAAASQADGWYSHGLITWNGTTQHMSSHTGQTLILKGAIPGLAEAFATSGSEAVSIARGCNKTAQTCQDKFDNMPNFGGFPEVGDDPWDGRRLT